ncbi:hypothetical protein LPJ75_005362 [Coemansia sp. RSA 2598]|nr:hypothetical protein LPJ75_005362 [Coemansia sp. RSA 2598]
MSVRAIVGAETDKWPEDVGFMLDSMEMAPPGHVSFDHGSLLFYPSPEVESELGQRGKWFRRLPKYAAEM